MKAFPTQKRSLTRLAANLLEEAAIVFDLLHDEDNLKAVERIRRRMLRDSINIERNEDEQDS